MRYIILSLIIGTLSFYAGQAHAQVSVGVTVKAREDVIAALRDVNNELSARIQELENNVVELAAMQEKTVEGVNEYNQEVSKSLQEMSIAIQELEARVYMPK